jgi:hypothetical protein
MASKLCCCFPFPEIWSESGIIIWESENYFKKSKLSNLLLQKARKKQPERFVKDVKSIYKCLSCSTQEEKLT